MAMEKFDEYIENLKSLYEIPEATAIRSKLEEAQKIMERLAPYQPLEQTKAALEQSLFGEEKNPAKAFQLLKSYNEIISKTLEKKDLDSDLKAYVSASQKFAKAYYYRLQRVVLDELETLVYNTVSGKRMQEAGKKIQESSEKIIPEIAKLRQEIEDYSKTLKS